MTDTQSRLPSNPETPGADPWIAPLTSSMAIHEQMLKIRHFEETVNELYKTAKCLGFAHLYSGGKAVAGWCEALRRD
jgi:TPP-dependent pyruvate/acetoin dehydrogenase alpha subunit